jgi:hypothetical protein
MRAHLQNTRKASVLFNKRQLEVALTYAVAGRYFTHHHCLHAYSTRIVLPSSWSFNPKPEFISW